MYFLLLCKIHKLGRCPLRIRTAVDLAYKLHGELGSATTVLVLHGLLGSKRNWESMCKRIKAQSGKTVVAVDARNHGESPHADSHTYPELASDVSQLINKLSIKKAIIIGHSMGGRTGMVLALTEPSKISGLVVVDISPMSTASALRNFFPDLLKAMQSINFEPNANIAQLRTEVKNKLISANVIDNASVGFILMNLGTKSNKSIGWVCNLDALSRYFGDVASFPTDTVSGKQYNGPTLFIGGEQSPYIPSSDLNGIKIFFPQAELKYVKAGHNVHAENPDAFLKLVLQFLSIIK